MGGKFQWAFRRYFAVGLVLGVGTLLSGIATTVVSRWEAANNQVRFQRHTEHLATALERSLNRYTDLLWSMGDLYRANPQTVNRKTFATFVERSLYSYPGIQALEWAERVPRSQRAAFEQQIRSQGYPAFQMTELAAQKTLVQASDRDEYFPVTYVEPLAENEAAFGFDLASNPVRRAAIEIARDAGQIIATGRIRLVQEQRDQFGFLVFLPVYKTGTPPNSIQERRHQLRGLLLGVFRISNVVEEALQDLQYNINFYIYDQSALDPGERFLGFYNADTQTLTSIKPQQSKNDIRAAGLCPLPSRCTHSISVAGRAWTVQFQPAAAYPTNLYYSEMATLLSGLLLTAMLALTLLSYQSKLRKTKEISELKLRFFSMASHELRTPLSSILLTAQSLQCNETNLSEQQQKSLQRIHAAAQRMTQLITDILTLTRAEVGKLEFTPEILDISLFCQQLADEMQPSLPQKVRFASNPPIVKAYLDRKLMRSLLTNLLSNASKYSPADCPIDFSLSAQASELVIRVSDQGIGIPVADLPRLYQAFYRGSNVGQTIGTGLGLAVVKTCVDLHRGSITIESRVNQGTTVTVLLPTD